ncbi:MAG: HD domain-containing protein [Bacteroidales bacterium]
MNKQKIINDPVHGFIHIRTSLAYELISHPYFQRLRGIKQLGLTHLVYPAACHSRFQHALGAMHLMHQAIETLQSKGQDISEAEAEAAECAILLHDIGHSPFSHALEFSFVGNLSHELISEAMMQTLNKQMQGRLALTLAIFKNTYHRGFFHQLVSSQLDVDRLDYLRRDSYFSGVVEGAIGVDRIIKMFDVVNDQIVVEEKGLHSVEKFLIARRLMYWQVYLHKTVIAAEQLLVNIFARAKHLVQQGEDVFAPSSLLFFLQRNITEKDLQDEEILFNFSALSDADIDCLVKFWTNHHDKVLSQLCQMLVLRKLPAVEIQKEAFSTERIKLLEEQTANTLQLSVEEAKYFVQTKNLINKAYNLTGEPIQILQKNGSLQNLYTISDMLNATAFKQDTTKSFLSYPKNIVH